MTSMKHWYQRPILDSMWYALLEIHDNAEVTIHAHDRDTRNPLTVGEFRFIEDDYTRIVKSVVIAGIEMKVRNPEFVFAYPRFKDLGLTP